MEKREGSSKYRMENGKLTMENGELKHKAIITSKKIHQLRYRIYFTLVFNLQQ